MYEIRPPSAGAFRKWPIDEVGLRIIDHPLADEVHQRIGLLQAPYAARIGFHRRGRRERGGKVEIRKAGREEAGVDRGLIHKLGWHVPESRRWAWRMRVEDQSGKKNHAKTQRRRGKASTIRGWLAPAVSSIQVELDRFARVLYCSRVQGRNGSVSQIEKKPAILSR